MVIYESAGHYIESCTNLSAKVQAIDNIINALLITAANAAQSDNITEYELNDGQTKIRTAYKGADAVFKSIQNFEKIKSYYVAKLNGGHAGVVRLVDSKNLRRY